MDKVIEISGKKYYYHSTYCSNERALAEGKLWRRTDKCKYFVMKVEEGLWFPEQLWRLYLSKQRLIWN